MSFICVHVQPNIDTKSYNSMNIQGIFNFILHTKQKLLMETSIQYGSYYIL